MSTIMATVEYLGNLRTQMKHVRSGSLVTTDAPVDNMGKGEAFSPTDLVSAALASCMMTIMGQVAQRDQVDLRGLKADVEKIMTASPRKIGEVHITFSHPDLKATDVQKQKLIHAARTCPVALSLSEAVIQKVTFNF